MILREDGEGLKNRQKYFVSQNIDIKNIVSTKLIHGNNVEIVSEDNRGGIIEETDGLITNTKNVCLTVTVGDCVPVIFFDKRNEVIGVAHAGWKGVVKNIVSVVVNKMNQKLNSDLENIQVAIGPHIKKCHFEIQEDIIDEFKDYSEMIIRKNRKIFVDLETILVKQLETSGIKKENIDTNSDCTVCNQEYFSFRRDKPAKVHSQVAWVVIN